MSIKDKLLEKKLKLELKIIKTTMKGLNEKQLWDLFGVLINAEHDKQRIEMLKYLDEEMKKRNIAHDFKEYLK